MRSVPHVTQCSIARKKRLVNSIILVFASVDGREQGAKKVYPAHLILDWALVDDLSKVVIVLGVVAGGQGLAWW